jgi:C-terminal processing protease CtpA/Prc
MLFELNVSHLFAGRISQIKRDASPYMFKSGNPGIDIRIIDSLVVVTRSSYGQSDQQITIPPGSIIHRIDGVDVNEILAGSPIYPPYNDRYKRFLQTEEVLRHLYGEAGTTVEVEYKLRKGLLVKHQLTRVERKKKIILWPEIPPIYLEVEQVVLEGGIGYLRFNAFQPSQPDQILLALGSLMKAKALVVDLRGNSGGSYDAQRLIGERLLDQRCAGALLVGRDGVDTMIFEGTNSGFKGPIAVLVDEVSISGAELLPHALQSLGRATIVGQQTPGAVMGANLAFISDSLALTYPTLTIKDMIGDNLENSGVKPDISISLDRRRLVECYDSQLEAAIEFLVDQIGDNSEN